MKYNKEINGVALIRDAYGKHFDNQVYFNYIVSILGDSIIESENPKEIAKECKKIGEQLLKIGRFMEKKKCRNMEIEDIVT